MSKKDVSIDTLAAGVIQAVTVATLTNPVTSVAAVAAITLMAGTSKYLSNRRDTEIKQLAENLCDAETAKYIKEMDEIQFLDDLSYSVEKILSQRTEPKRILMRNVFLGYIKSQYKESYPLERMYKTVENLTFADVKIFRQVLEATRLKEKYPIPWVTKAVMDNHKIPKTDQAKLMILTYSEDGQTQQSLANLVSEGLLKERHVEVGQWGAGGGSSQFYITHFGKYFQQYLLDTQPS